MQTNLDNDSELLNSKYVKHPSLRLTIRNDVRLLGVANPGSSNQPMTSTMVSLAYSMAGIQLHCYSGLATIYTKP